MSDSNSRPTNSQAATTTASRRHWQNVPVPQSNMPLDPLPVVQSCSALDPILDFLAGTVADVSGLAVGFPFDTDERAR